MTSPSGLPSGMDPFALDAGTAERLLIGVVDAGDAPPEYRAVARVVHELRSAPDSVEWAGELAAVEKIAAAVVVRPRPWTPRRARRSWRFSPPARLAAAAALASAVCLTGGLASAGALPARAQTAASTVLGTVGISVPTGGGEPARVQQPPATTTPVATTPTPPGSGAPAPRAGVSRPASSSPATPGNGQDTKAHGSPPINSKGNGNDHTGDGSPNGNGNGNGR